MLPTILRLVGSSRAWPAADVFVVPVSLLVMRSFTTRYLERGALGGAIAFGLRYLLVGGWLALVIKVFLLCGEISDTPFIVCLGGAIRNDAR